MRKHAADYEIGSRISEVHYPDSLKRWKHQPGIWSAIDSPIWIIDQWWKICSHSRGTKQHLIDFTRLSAIVINNHLMQAGDNEVYRTSRFDFSNLGDQLDAAAIVNKLERTSRVESF